MPKKHRTALLVFLFLLIYYFSITIWFTGGLIFENLLKMKLEEKALIVLGALAVALFAMMIDKRVRF